MILLKKYEVVFRDENGNRWSVFYIAKNFADAEKQALNDKSAFPDPIIIISEDYNAETYSSRT